MEIKLTNVVFPNRKRLLMIMMKTLIFLCCTTVFSFTPSNVLSQNSKIKIEADKTLTVDEVFDLIMDQTDYRFIYEKGIFKNFPNVAVHKGTISTNSLLVKSLANKNLNIIVTANNTILIKEAKTVQQIQVSGKVTDEKGLLLPGVTVLIKGTSKGTVTDFEGSYTITVPNPENVLLFSYLGYETQEILVAGKSIINVTLKEQISELEEVTLNFNTGYQQLPKERATGSFVHIDSALINRRVGTNILERLEGLTSGLLFNSRIQDGNNNSNITIRGRSTIFANPNPLIIVDNFPYDGDINSINPNDIEDITILKDAAAASIWGVRAGNGVIVISTKKGSQNTKPSISINSNVTLGQKPDVYYPSQISSPDFIGVEKFLFDQGFYDNEISNGYSAISPAVALMQQLREGGISQNVYDREIALLASYDVRDDLKKYFYRSSINQQLNVNISGGNDYQKYFISGGFDKNLDNLSTNSFERVTINANNTYNLLKDKLQVFTGVYFSQNTTGSNADTYRPYRPYDRLADNNGNPLPVTDFFNQNLRASYVDTVGNDKLLDWHYYPLNERNENREAKLTGYRFLSGITYNIMDYLKLQVNYQYQQDEKKDVINRDQNSFYTRNYINRFSSIDETGTVNRVVALGAIVDRFNTSIRSHYGRIQLSYDHVINEKHAITALGGFEVKDYQEDYFGQRYYGYNPELATNSNSQINPMEYYKIYYDPFGYSTIATSPSESGAIDRYRSWYFNAAYTLNNLYTISGSVRKDETNLFGVKANQKGVPLWSAGASWNIGKEAFYHSAFLPNLKLRMSFGYNGNVDKTTSAYLTAHALFYNNWNVNYSTITNPPNPSLGWEKIQNVNLGLDFALKNHVVSGSFEYYQKKGTDLMGNSPIAPQTGVTYYRGNNADSEINGFDATINFIALNKGVKWDIDFLYSYMSNKITKYKALQGINGTIVNGNYRNPLEGYPYSSVFAFRSAGLDSEGNPRGYLNGDISTEYSDIYNSTDSDELIFKGSAVPTSFGSLRNNLRFKDFTLSVNVIYKLDYYFRRTGAFSGSNYSNYTQGDFADRWQNPGDELTTRVPALVYPQNNMRDLFYLSSEDVVEKGDHIRLQDIRLSYQLNKKNLKWLPFHTLQIYSYINNIGIIWRANKKEIDPDVGTQLIPAGRTFAFGVNTTF